MCDSSAEKRRCHAPVLIFRSVMMPIWMLELSPFNIHVAGHHNNSIVVEHGYYIHPDASRPNGYDYTAHRNVWDHRGKNCGILALIPGILMPPTELPKLTHMNITSPLFSFPSLADQRLLCESWTHEHK